MSLFDPSRSDDVDHLLRNAALRDALEPLLDESIDRVNAEVMSTGDENAFLQSMLEWERAPIVPICDWFSPRLELPHPDDLTDAQLNQLLYRTIDELYEQRIVLDFTDHLSDRQLYCLIFRDILPSHEKMIQRRDSFLHWDCANMDGDPEIWLRFYASDEERHTWQQETQGTLPELAEPPYPRDLPRAPL